MTAAHALLAEATRHGVQLFAVGDGIEYEAPEHPPAELLARLRQHRDELRGLLAAPPREPEPDRLRVVVDGIEPVPGPVRLNPWTVVLHPELSIKADLASLERVVGALAEARRTGDRRAMEQLEDDVAELLERLERCGAKVRVRIKGVQP